MTVGKWMASGLASMGMLALILDGKTALAGAVSGVDLCLKTVIPSLFPFLFLSSILTGTLWGGQHPWLHPVGRRLGIPNGAESLLICAVFGGYPAGAQAVGEAFQSHRLSKTDAEHLLTFCSNAGPAFLFGMVSLQFPDKKTVWVLWHIQMIAAIATGTLFSSDSSTEAQLPGRASTISHTLVQTVKNMAIICGWIILFRILSDFLNRWLFWFFPKELQVICTGLLELSNGCCALTQIQNSSLRFLVCSGILSFGGLCVTMQTASVIDGLSLKPYLLGKLTQTAISLILSLLYLTRGWFFLSFAATGFLVFPNLLRKRSRFPEPQGV